MVENGNDLAEWLGIDFLEGTSEDRPVVLELRHRLVQDLDKGLRRELRPCFDGGQELVFCSSRRGAEKTARFLSDEMKLKIPTETRKELYSRESSRSHGGVQGTRGFRSGRKNHHLMERLCPDEVGICSNQSVA